MSAEQGLTRNQVVAVLTRSPHGDLAQYAPVATQAVREDPAFYSHLVAWNAVKGSVRDAKVALPVLAMTSEHVLNDSELRSNAYAHVLALNPRELLRAVQFGRAQKVRGRNYLNRLVELYLRERESSEERFVRVVLQHRKVLKALYVWTKLKPSPLAQGVLFDGVRVGLLETLHTLKGLSPVEIAGVVVGKRLPFLPTMGALGSKAKDPDVLQALMTVMSPNELVNNTKMLERLGVLSNPALRATYNTALQRVSTSKAAIYKTSVAADAVGGAMSEKLRGAQEKQAEATGVDGDWLVLADKSGSMGMAINAAREVASVLARAAKGKVHLVFFDSSPTHFDVTGLSLDKITEITRHIFARGSTGAGCGVDYLRAKGLSVDGIAVVSDGGENQIPVFAEAYLKYSASVGKDIPVYFYRLRGDRDVLSTNCARAGVDIHTFDLTGGVDYYSLPNLVQTMRANRYGLSDEIMSTPLLRLEDVLSIHKTAKEEVS